VRDRSDRTDRSDRADRPTTESLSRQRLADVTLWRGVQRDLRLSDREIQVAIRLVLGDTIRQIAGRLGVMPCTVLTYQKRVKAKLRVRYRGELVTKLVLASGLLLGE
jgi:DNA-binding CsgD family transcriptional regulator